MMAQQTSIQNVTYLSTSKGVFDQLQCDACLLVIHSVNVNLFKINPVITEVQSA